MGKIICGGAALVVFGGGANFNVWGLSPPKPPPLAVAADLATPLFDAEYPRNATRYR